MFVAFNTKANIYSVFLRKVAAILTPNCSCRIGDDTARGVRILAGRRKGQPTQSQGLVNVRFKETLLWTLEIAVRLWV